MTASAAHAAIRKAHLDYAIRELRRLGIAFEQLTGSHLRIGRFDYWPSTGVYIDRETRVRGEGFEEMLEAMRGGG